MRIFRPSFFGWLVTVALALLFCTHVQAQTLDDANRAFAEGHYHESTLDFQAVLKEKGYSAPVLFDLGNSYFREGDLPEAILAYKRAQLLAPGDQDIAANLRMAEKQAGISVPDPRLYEQIATSFSPNGWALTGSAALVVLCVALFLRALWPKRPGLGLLTGASALTLIVAGAAMFWAWRDVDEAVVIDPKAAALISPFPAAQVLYSPAPGEMVTVRKAYNDFLLVRDASGHSGWMSKTQIAPVIPPS
jgi:tetratricopeptide (TPR) repeat protein